MILTLIRVNIFVNGKVKSRFLCLEVGVSGTMQLLRYYNTKYRNDWKVNNFCLSTYFKGVQGEGGGQVDHHLLRFLVIWKGDLICDAETCSSCSLTPARNLMCQLFLCVMRHYHDNRILTCWSSRISSFLTKFLRIFQFLFFKHHGRIIYYLGMLFSALYVRGITLIQIANNKGIIINPTMPLSLISSAVKYEW